MSNVVSIAAFQKEHRSEAKVIDLTKPRPEGRVIHAADRWKLLKELNRLNFDPILEEEEIL